MYCYTCGFKLEEGDKICPNCGTKLDDLLAEKNKNTDQKDGSIPLTTKAAKKMNDFADQLNAATGGEGHVELRFRDFFVNVFKRHTEEEQNEIFACGSEKTTPAPQDIAREWPKPWYYTRLFITLLATTLLLYFIFTNGGTAIALPGLLFVGAMLGPMPILMFFFEVNLPRNISIITVIRMFFLGGCLSIITTLLFYRIMPESSGEIVSALLVGVVEEAGKAAVIAYYIRKYTNKRYIFNGLLIGGAIGAGFAVIESSAYIYAGCMELYDELFSYGVRFNADALMDILTIRGFFALGGHVAWGAVTGAAIVIALNHEDFKWDVLSKPVFLKFLLINIVLHGVWDMNPIILPLMIKYVSLCCIVWIVIVIILNRGLSEINEIDEASPSN